MPIYGFHQPSHAASAEAVSHSEHLSPFGGWNGTAGPRRTEQARRARPLSIDRNQIDQPVFLPGLDRVRGGLRRIA